MNCKYIVRNFRIFDTKGAEIALRPITLLTGCNSSGKSSLVKSLLLWKNFVDQAKTDKRTHGRFCPQNYTLDFTLPGMKLGSVETAKNRKSDKNDPIIIGYKIKPSGSLIELQMTLEFIQKLEEDVKASFDGLTISSAQSGEVILDIVVDDENCKVRKFNLNNELLSHFWRFYSFACFRQAKEWTFHYRGKEDNVVADAYEKDAGEILMDIYAMEPKLSAEEADAFDVAYENLKSSLRFSALDFDKKTYDIIKKSFSRGVLFYLPILEEYIEASKEEAISKLKAHSSKTNSKLIDKIIHTFELSEFDNFFEFYKSLEDQRLENIEELFEGHSHDGEDLISYIKNVCHTTTFSYNEEITIEHIFKQLAKIHLYTLKSEVDKHIEVQNEIISSKIFSQYLSYFLYLTEQTLLPKFADGINYIGNSNTTIQRVYSFEDKDNNLVDTIQEFDELKRKFNKFSKTETYTAVCSVLPKWKSYSPGAFTNKWIKELGLGSSIKISVDKDGLGAKLLIRKNNEDKSYTSLADEGYGVTQIVILLLRIEIGILNTIVTSKYITSNKVDFTSWTLAIEEPEVSLHPSMQSNLARIFEDAHSTYKLNFIIETHSEYLIRKIQTKIANKELSQKQVSIYYFSNNSDEPVKNIGLDQGGALTAQFGPGFFDEADSLAFELMKAKLSF